MVNEILRISEFPDELLLKILYLLPTSKDVVATSILSKRWRSLWKEVKTFKFEGKSLGRRYWKFVRFISRRSNVECLQLKLNRHFGYKYIKPLINIAVVRYLKELRIDMLYNSFEFPKSFYISSQLETLILEKLSLEDVPSNVHMISVKRLHLLSVMFQGDHSVETLLSICPRLEDLVVRRSSYTNVRIFTIDVPTLTSLSIDNTLGKSRPKGPHGFVINTPSLRSFSIKDSFSNYLQFENMPELVHANVNVVCDQPDKFLGSLASTKYLSLCSVNLQIPYSPTGISFLFLDHLEICTCSANWWNLLTSILDDAPRLRVLQLRLKHCDQYNDEMDLCSPLSFVPECLSSHLEIFEWRQFKGTVLEKEVAKYILENSSHLMKATFY